MQTHTTHTYALYDTVAERYAHVNSRYRLTVAPSKTMSADTIEELESMRNAVLDNWTKHPKRRGRADKLRACVIHRIVTTTYVEVVDI